MSAADELWSQKLSVGVDQIDDHHRALIRLLVECRDAAGSARGRDEVRDILAALVSYSKYHFLAEERLMVEIGYPLLQAQRDAHREFSGRLEDIVSAFSSDPGSFRRELFVFLKEWFIGHIVGQDALIGSFLRQKGEGGSD